jgi:competence protein ComEA
VGVLAVAVVVGGVFGMRSAPPTATAGGGFEVVTTRSAAEIRVHVGGWVVERSVVRLPPGSLVADAIRAAGGARPGADLDALNLAMPLQDGSQVIVPGPGGAGEAAGTPGLGGDGRVRINTATQAEIETLPGVGPVLAQRIIAHREQHGPFRDAEDLLGVPGIGEAKYAALRDLVVIP